MGYNKLLFLFVLFLTISHFFFRVYSYRDSYIKPYDANYWEKRYSESQWVVSYSKNPIGDDGLYAYVGWEYVNGHDPTLLNAEVPPFGKYIIGWSIILFHNQNIFALLSGILVLVSFFWLNVLLFKDKLLALIPVALFSFEPLFYTQLRAPFLDLLYLGLLFLTFIFFLKQKYLFAMIALGLMMATKASSGTFLIVTVTLGLYLLLRHDFSTLKRYLLYLPISLGVFTLCYLQFFLLGHSFIEFLKVQKYAINFYAIGAKAVPLSIWHIIFTGSWPTWFGTVEKVREWSILWPVMLVLTFISLIFLLVKKNKKTMMIVVGLWVIVYFAFLHIVPIFPRYLLLVLPFMYNLTIWLIPSLRGIRLR